jgi:hypothetical protein
MSSSIEVEVILNPIVNPFYVTATNMIVHIDTISILVIKNILETIIITISNIFDSNISSTDLKYVVDLYIGGVQQVRVKLYPEPTTGIGYFDAGPIVRNTMTYRWLTPNTNVLMCEPNVSGQIAQTYQ